MHPPPKPAPVLTGRLSSYLGRPSLHCREFSIGHKTGRMISDQQREPVLFPPNIPQLCHKGAAGLFALPRARFQHNYVRCFASWSNLVVGSKICMHGSLLLQLTSTKLRIQRQELTRRCTGAGSSKRMCGSELSLISTGDDSRSDLRIIFRDGFRRGRRKYIIMYPNK